MKIQIDPRSAVFGLLAGIVMMLTIGAVTNPPNGPVGRFNIAIGAHNALIVDTVTGQVWRGQANAPVSPEFAEPKIGPR